jgi:hypothetical protein
MPARAVAILGKLLENHEWDVLTVFALKCESDEFPLCKAY